MDRGSVVPEEPPWLREGGLRMAATILAGHQRLFGRVLLAGSHTWSARQAAQELFGATPVVLAHDGGHDPRLIYANAAALRLWDRPWASMVGMPSRLTAEPLERPARQLALDLARRQEAIANYAGVRVNRQGRRFRIEGARLWTLQEGSGQPLGQAACFESWWWL